MSERRDCSKCGRREPTSIFDGTCSEGGACEFLTSEERDRTRCRSTLRGERCAYERGHSGCHWGITPEGEETWSEESKALADVAAQLRTAAIAIELLTTQKGSSRS